MWWTTTCLRWALSWTCSRDTWTGSGRFFIVTWGLKNLQSYLYYWKSFSSISSQTCCPSPTWSASAWPGSPTPCSLQASSTWFWTFIPFNSKIHLQLSPVTLLYKMAAPGSRGMSLQLDPSTKPKSKERSPSLGESWSLKLVYTQDMWLQLHQICGCSYPPTQTFTALPDGLGRRNLGWNLIGP